MGEFDEDGGSDVSPIVKFNVRGDAELRRNIATLRAVFPEFVDRALKYEAQDILNAALERTPMEMGELRATGRVRYERRGTGHFAGVSFGGTPETNPYALAIHEEPPSPHHPPSWQRYFAKTGDSLHWTTAGTGHKYLENAVREAQSGMLARIAEQVRKSISSSFI